MDIENLKTELKKQIDEKIEIQKNIEELMKRRKLETSDSESEENEEEQNENKESLKSG